MCLTRPSSDIPGIPAASPYKGNSSYSSYSNCSRDIPVFPVFPDIPVFPDTPETFRTFQSFMTFQPFQAILQVPVFPGIPPHSSILRLECVFYNFYRSYSSIGFHRKLHRVPVGQLQTLQTLQTLHSSKKGRCCDIGQTCIGKRCQDDIFPRIELIPLSSCQVTILITRMLFNSSLSCLMSKVSIEITINTSKWQERAKQWNDNSQFSSHK